jgi:hypothetical protein
VNDPRETGPLAALFEHLLAFRALVLSIAGRAAALAPVHIHISYKDAFRIAFGTFHVNTSGMRMTCYLKYLGLTKMITLDHFRELVPGSHTKGAWFVVLLPAIDNQ